MILKICSRQNMHRGAYFRHVAFPKMDCGCLPCLCSARPDRHEIQALNQARGVR